MGPSNFSNLIPWQASANKQGPIPALYRPAAYARGWAVTVSNMCRRARAEHAELHVICSVPAPPQAAVRSTYLYMHTMGLWPWCVRGKMALWGSLAVIAGTGGAAFFFYWRRRRQQSPQLQLEGTHTDASNREPDAVVESSSEEVSLLLNEE